MSSQPTVTVSGALTPNPAQAQSSIWPLNVGGTSRISDVARLAALWSRQ